MRKLTEKITGPLTTSEVFGEWEPIGKQGEKEFKFELLTPMFGGGPKAGHINNQEGFELRAATVRGHLREWWRRLYRTSSNGQLLKLEAEIWGAVGQKHGDVRASNVKIQVQVKSVKTDDQWWDGKKIKEDYSAYALFPFPMLKNDKDQKEPPEFCLSAMTFVVTIMCKNLDDEQKEQVYQSLRAWANFGGVGARTRRGVGAIWCDTLACRDEADIVSLAAKVAGARLLYRTPGKDAAKDILAVWKGIVKTMEDFRRPAGRGASPWPEAQSVLGHPQPVGGAKPRGVPRAAFGLPLAMQDVQKNYTETLYPYRNGNKINRMSSPIILRPVKTQKGAVLQVALFLAKADFTNITVGSDAGKRFSLQEIFSADFGKCVTSMKNYDDAVEAYHGYLMKQRFTSGGEK